MIGATILKNLSTKLDFTAMALNLVNFFKNNFVESMVKTCECQYPPFSNFDRITVSKISLKKH